MRYLVIFLFLILFFLPSFSFAQSYYLIECHGKNNKGKNSPGVFSYIIDKKEDRIWLIDINSVFQNQDTYAKITSHLTKDPETFISNVFYFKGHEKVKRQLTLYPSTGTGWEKIWTTSWWSGQKETMYYINCKQTNYNDIQEKIKKKENVIKNKQPKLEKNKQNIKSKNSKIVETKNNSFSFKKVLGKLLSK